MNDLQCVIDRQLGLHTRFNYDNILKRFVVNRDESFYGLQNTTQERSFEQDPPIFACRFSEAGGYEHILALANEDGKIAIQDTSNASTACTVESYICHTNAIFDLAWMPKHNNFVTVSGDHTACLWNVNETGPTRVLSFSYHTCSVKTATFCPDEPAVFATGARDGHILVWDVRVNNQSSVVLKPDNCLMNCHSSFTPKTPGSHSKRPRIDARAISITGLVFQDDRSLISCGECDGSIKVWDLRKNYSVYKREPLPKHSIPYCGSSTKNGYTNLIIDDARTRLYASCMDNVIYCYNISTYNSLPEQRYIGHENSTFYIKTCLSPDSMYLVSGSSDKNAYIWNVKYSEPIVKLVGHWAEVTCAAWCPKGDMKIVTCSDDARHKIWRIGSEYNDSDEEFKGKAESVPWLHNASHRSQWGALDKTPTSLKRKMMRTPTMQNAQQGRKESASGKRTKRCLAYLMNATKEDEASSAKRVKLDNVPDDVELRPLDVGAKRRAESPAPGAKKKCVEASASSDWCYAPRAGCSFTTPTKNYEKKNCKLLSPKSPKMLSPNSSPDKVSPTKVRTISFTTPTKNLPDFVLNGEAPHMRLMSPAKKKRDSTNWLTLMVREKMGKVEEKNVTSLAPVSPRENAPPRRNSATERMPKRNKNRTLLEYFSVGKIDK
ncbi:unnamed protein product [Leptosia nina]|uniref:Protein lethal(2)denticleless n=1 Tax=Leptosia nina TaxID=320188 RepID=A0AAV1IXH4_9NEOP